MDRLGGSPQTLLGAAAGVVLGCVVVFALIGAIRGDDGPTDDPTIAAGETDAPSDDPTADPTPTGDATAAPTEQPTATDAPTAAATDEPSQEPSDEPATPAETVDPAEISVQVLDATGTGDRSAANAVADELRAAGYDVVVVNPASQTYDVTTVFWTAGQDAGGRQLAAALGTSEASETPAEVSLSSSVDAHVVVGADRT